MKSKYYISFFFLLIIAGSLVSCKKYTEIPPPVSLLAATSVFNNISTATAAQLVLYGQMYPNQRDLEKSTGLSSDELYTYATDQTSKDLYSNALNASVDAATLGVNYWATAYHYIYEENAVLEGLQNSNGVSPAIKQQLTGEAIFTRAYWYFWLVNLYGDAPLITTTDYKVNSAMGRTPKADVYKKIISDLKDAQNLLNNNFVDATDTAITTERIRPTKWAATALLARVYLYTGDYANADLQASSLISNNAPFALALVPNPANVFLKNSTEAIWQLSPNTVAGVSTPEGGSFILTTSPGPSSNNSTISTQLLNAFETGDKRKANWIGSYTSTTNTTYNFPYKYHDNGTNTTLHEYSMMLRLGEQVLIRAEARVQEGNIAGAIADLNIIRNRAGLANYSGATDQASLLTAIAHERQIELFVEGGHRWLDLKRTGMVDAVMTVVTPLKGNSWKSYQQLYPLVLTDVLNSPNLPQNLGY